MQKCKVCDSEVNQITILPYTSDKQVNCSRCGIFRITDSLLASDLSYLTQEERISLSSYLRNNSTIEKPLLLSSYTIDEIVRISSQNMKLPVSEKLSTILNYIVQLTNSTVGKQTAFDIFNDFTIFYCKDSQEFKSFLSELAKRGWIEIISGNPRIHTLSLTVNGLEYYETSLTKARKNQERTAIKNSYVNNELYDVVLSFSGEDRKHASKLAELLMEDGYKVFYDDDESDDLWGKNLIDHFYEIYNKAGKYCVMFISQHYAIKNWTIYERRIAQEKAFRQKEEYILPIRIDDTDIPGLGSTIGIQDLRRKSIEEIYEILKKKIEKNKASLGHEGGEKEDKIFKKNGIFIACDAIKEFGEILLLISDYFNKKNINCVIANPVHDSLPLKLSPIIAICISNRGSLIEELNKLVNLNKKYVIQILLPGGVKQNCPFEEKNIFDLNVPDIEIEIQRLVGFVENKLAEK